MPELNTLTAQRDAILAKIREIEENCEGIDNENNARRVQALNLQQVQLTLRKQEIKEELLVIQAELTAVADEIAVLSGTGVDRILEAIKKQRWYYFRNKKTVLMDKTTGLLWNNPNYVHFFKEDGEGYSAQEAMNILETLNRNGSEEWRIVNHVEFEKISYGGTDYPFYTGDTRQIANCSKIIMDWNGDGGIRCYWMDYDYGKVIGGNDVGVFLIYSECLVKGSDYENNVSPGNTINTEKERLQFTLDLFVQHGLWPVFEDDEITQLYRRIYIDKPALLQQLQELQTQIESLQTVTLLSAEFDGTALLQKYDIAAIDQSIILYYQAIQQWTEELMEKLNYYEKQKESVIRDFNLISLQLSRKYEQSPSLTDAENAFFEERQKYFQKKFSLGMNRVTSKILAIKKQADDLEYRLDEIDNGDNVIVALAAIEKEERASFSLIAENTMKIIRNALQKIEYFETNHAFVQNAISIWANWTEDYRVFKTTYQDDFKNSCVTEGIEEAIWGEWYADWQKIRYNIECKVQPMIERGLAGEFAVEKEDEITVPEQIIAELAVYKNNTDQFFLQERKGIYQKFVFQSGGDLQDKFETESCLYKYTSQFQTALQEIIFNCTKTEDRVFILNWANSLLDIQIDEILSFVADHDLQKISKTILEEFAMLKQKNYEVYLTDAKAYSEEKAEREKQYNSLVFKMRKDLMK